MRRGRLVVGLAAGIYCVAAILSIGNAVATPQFARETKLPCSSCHQHVPLLNKFGQQFYANGFRLPKSHKMVDTVPAWVNLEADATTSGSLGSAVPIKYSGTEIASYGNFGPRDIYHFEYQPTTSQIYPYELHSFGSGLSVQMGEMGLLSQYDPRLDITNSRPVYLQPAGAGPLGNGRFGPFAPGSNVYGFRAVTSISGASSMPYADGWKVAATVPFSDEAPCGNTPDFDTHPTGTFLETYRRDGMNSYGVNTFLGGDGRRYYGAVAQRSLGKVLLEGGVSYATWDAFSTRMASVSGSWAPTPDKAIALRIDDQDGFVNYVPTLSWLLSRNSAAVRLIAESTITHGVAPTTTFSVELKF